MPTESPTSITLGAKVASFAALAAHACGHMFIMVSMPIIGRNLGFSDVQTGMLVGLSALLLVMSGPLWGFYSDRKGRRPVILIGMFAAAFFPLTLAILISKGSSLGLTSTVTFAILLTVRIVQVASSGGVVPAFQAWFADTTSPKDRSKGMAFMGMSYGFGSILGASLVWLSRGEHQSLTLYGLALALIISFIAIAYTLPQSKRTNTTPQNVKISFSPLTLWPFLTATMGGLMVYSCVTQVLPLRLMDEFGLGNSEATAQSGKIMMMAIVGMVFMQALAARKLALPPMLMLFTGTLMTVISMFVATFAPSIPILTISIVSLGLAFGLFGPGNMALLSLTAHKDNQAKAAGVNVVAKGIGMAVGPIAGAFLHQLGPHLPFLCGTLTLALVLMIAFHIRKHPSFAI